MRKNVDESCIMGALMVHFRLKDEISVYIQVKRICYARVISDDEYIEVGSFDAGGATSDEDSYHFIKDWCDAGL